MVLKYAKIYSKTLICWKSKWS